MVSILRKTVSVTVSLLNNSSNVNHFITIQAGYVLCIWSIIVIWCANKKKSFELHKFHWTRSTYTPTSQGCPVHRPRPTMRHPERPLLRYHQYQIRLPFPSQG